MKSLLMLSAVDRHIDFKRLLCAATVLLLSTWSVQAQQTKKTPEANMAGAGMAANWGNEQGAYYTFDARYSGMVGSPYLVLGWHPGDLFLTDGRNLKNIPIRYDVYSRRLILREGKDSLWLSPRLVKEFVMHDAPTPAQPEKTDRRFISFSAAPIEEQRDSFVEVVFEGPHYALLKYPRKKLVKANYSGAYTADRRFDELIDREDYYLRRPDGSVVEVKLNAKSLSSVSPELESKLKAEMSRSKRNLKTEADAVALLAVIDTK